MRALRPSSSVVVPLGYLLVSFLYFGVRLLPRPDRELLGTGTDPQLFVWSIGWWPHALGRLVDPFYTDVVWAPHGLNLAWTTSVPGIALPVAPVTVLFGPAAAYNLAGVLIPALAAWTAFLLCRHVTGRLWPALVGGYLFGFSSYMLGHELGHMHMSSVFLVPLVALVLLRFVEGTLEGRGLAWRLGLLLGFQIYLSTELLFTTSFAAGVAVALAYLSVPSVRPRLRALVRPVAGAAVLALLVASPLLGHAIVDFERGTINPPRWYNADLLNFVVPTRLVAAGGDWASGLSGRFQGNDAERGAYLGLPVLIIVAWFAFVRRQSPSARFLLLCLAAAFACALGTDLWVGGRHVVTLPWELVSRLPLFNNVLPVRFSLFASLAAAVIVASWSAAPGISRKVRLVLPAAAVLALVPAVHHASWVQRPDRPAFFASSALLRSCLSPDENLIVFPYDPFTPSMLWQAENDYRFRMAQGYLRPDIPGSFRAFPVVEKLMWTGEPATIEEILELARAKGVARLVATDPAGFPRREELERVTSVEVVGDVLVAPACGDPPLAD